MTFELHKVALAVMVLSISCALPARAQTSDTLPDLPHYTASGGELSLALTAMVAPSPVQVGPLMVANLPVLVVCPTGETCAPEAAYGGAVLTLGPSDRLLMELSNQLPGPPGTMPEHCMAHSQDWSPVDGWAADNSLFNLHTHGLLVAPDKRQGPNGIVFGDNIFTCPSNGEGRSYDIAMNPGGAQPHPTGSNWFHPHVHGIAKAQVSSGMAGMIVVPDTAADESEGRVWRDILLKDAQLVQPVADGPWLNFADQDPGFCGGYPEDPATPPGPLNFLSADNLGECTIDAGLAADLGIGGNPAADGKWLFTLNGAEYPTLVVPAPATPDGVAPKQFWRIQNASANITYRLTLREIGAAHDKVVLEAPFEVLSMDGAGIVGPADTRSDAPRVREIILMPGSRVELAVSSPDPTRTLDYQMVNEAFEAGFRKEIADTWPRIALAHVAFEGAPQAQVAAAEQIVATTGPEQVALRANETFLARRGLQPGAMAPPVYDQSVLDGCADLAQAASVGGAKMRRIYFGIGANPDDGKEFFVLGETFVETDPLTGATQEFGRDGTPIPADGKIRLESFNPRHFTCALRSALAADPETWELVNVSAEVHNFHIHQLKFPIARTANGAPLMRAPSAFDRVDLPAKLFLASGANELLHDTVVVPRGTEACDGDLDFVALDSMEVATFDLDRAAHPECSGDGRPGDGSGMLTVKLAFAGAQFASYPDPDAPDRMLAPDFVYHCHILEHEDNGMMAAIRVLDPALIGY